MKPETISTIAAFGSAAAAIAAAGTALISYSLGKRQILAAKEVAQRQIESAQAVAQRQVESAQAVARMQLIMPMREAWIGQLRTKLSFLVPRHLRQASL
jgi:hypothetical protein